MTKICHLSTDCDDLSPPNTQTPLTGGMEELTLEQIKKKTELEEDIDFENGRLDFLGRTVMSVILLRVSVFDYTCHSSPQVYSQFRLDLKLGWTSVTKVGTDIIYRSTQTVLLLVFNCSELLYSSRFYHSSKMAKQQRQR